MAWTTPRSFPVPESTRVQHTMQTADSLKCQHHSKKLKKPILQGSRGTYNAAILLSKRSHRCLGLCEKELCASSAALQRLCARYLQKGTAPAACDTGAKGSASTAPILNGGHGPSALVLALAFVAAAGALCRFSGLVCAHGTSVPVTAAVSAVNCTAVT